MLNVDEIVWVTELEILRHGDVEMTEKDVTITQLVQDNAIHIQVTPISPLFAAHMHLLVVTKAYDRDRRMLARTAFFVDGLTHNEGPYDVFRDQALINMKTHETLGTAESYYTREFPRKWTGCMLMFPIQLVAALGS